MPPLARNNALKNAVQHIIVAFAAMYLRPIPQTNYQHLASIAHKDILSMATSHDTDMLNTVHHLLWAAWVHSLYVWVVQMSGSDCARSNRLYASTCFLLVTRAVIHNIAVRLCQQTLQLHADVVRLEVKVSPTSMMHCNHALHHLTYCYCHVLS